MTALKFGTTVRALVAAATGALLLAGCGGSSGSSSGGGAGASAGAGGWSQDFSGTQLNVIAEATANSGILQKLLPDFTAKTGISVTLEQAPYDSLVQKAVLDFTAKKGNYDVLSIPYEYLGAFAEKGYISPVDDWTTSPTGAGKDFSTAAIIPSLWEASSKWKDHWYGVPSNSAVMMMMYRKDVMADPMEKAAFQKEFGYPLAPAKTWQQYQDNARFLTRAAGDSLMGRPLSQPFYGVSLAGKRHIATVLEWMNYSWTFGGNIFNDAGQPALNSPSNVAALDYEMGLTDYAPPGFSSATWDEVTAALQQGTAGQAITWGDTAGAMEDKTQSKVVGQMGYANIPTKNEGDPTEAHLGSWTYSLNAESKNQDAGKLFMAWALSTPVQRQLATGGGLPALTSTFEDPTLVKDLPYWKQTLSSLEQARSRPRIPQWSGISDLMSLAISQVLSGQESAQAALDQGQEQLVNLMQGALPVTYQ